MTNGARLRDLVFPVWGTLAGYKGKGTRESAASSLPMRLLFLGDYAGQPTPHTLEDRPCIRLGPGKLDEVESRLRKGAGEGLEQRWAELRDAEARAGAANAALGGDRVHVDVLDCSLDDLRADMDDASSLSRCGMFKQLITGQFGGFGGKPYDAVVARLGFEKADLAKRGALTWLADIASLAHAPLFVDLAEGVAADPAYAVLAASEPMLRPRTSDIAARLMDGFVRHPLFAETEGMDEVALGALAAARVARHVKVFHRAVIVYSRTPRAVEQVLRPWLASHCDGTEAGAGPLASVTLAIDEASPGAMCLRFALEAEVRRSAGPHLPVRAHGELGIDQPFEGGA